MRKNKIICPSCSSQNVTCSDKRKYYFCQDCSFKFTLEDTSKRIFLSYGHDEYAALAQRVKTDLEARGHQVWFDIEQLTPGRDWEAYIERGLDWVSEKSGVGRVVLVMTPHSVRRPDGFCLNEISRAIMRKLPIVPVMLVDCEPPLSICRIQYLDMRDCVPVEKREQKYKNKFEILCDALEYDTLDFEGAQAKLLTLFKPLPFDAEILFHLSGFVGREWVFKELDRWLGDPEGSKVFWITGVPGVGKTAISAWLCYNRPEIASFHFCIYDNALKSDPRRCVLSMAYQLTTQLPDYQSRLNSLDLQEIVTVSDAKTLFDLLVIQPILGIPRPNRMIAILIDALDEATKDNRNELAELIASEFEKTPDWLRLIITSRPEPLILSELESLQPFRIDASDPRNLNDILFFLKKELRTTSKSTVNEAMIHAILDKSEGVFLYAKLVLDELRCGGLSLDRLEEFPKGLRSVFRQFFKRQFPDVDRYKKIQRPLLEIVAAAAEPLSQDLICLLLNWGRYEKKDCLEPLGSLFNFAGCLRPFHKSIIDWLTDENTVDFFVDAKQGHKVLADYGWKYYKSDISKMPDYFLKYETAHLVRLEQWEDLAEILCDPVFVETKCRAGMATDIVYDYVTALNAMPKNDLSQRVRHAFSTNFVGGLLCKYLKLHIMKFGNGGYRIEYSAL
jgi:hypothetical protein